MTTITEVEQRLGTQVEPLAALGVGVVDIDLAGTIRSWSAGAALLYGRDADEMVGTSIGEVRLWGPDPAAASIANELLATGRWQGEVTVTDASGAPLELQVRVSAVLSDRRERVGFQAALLDVSGRVAADQRSAERASRLRLADRVAGLGAWEWDPHGDELLTSDAFTSLLGLRPGTALTMAQALAAIVPADRERVRSALDQMRRGDLDSFSLQYRVTGSDGAVSWLEAHCGAARARDGTLTRVQGITQNVTASVLATERLREAQAFGLATLDSLTSHVAVLDEHGAIIAVNASWRRFAEREGGQSDYVGQNYLSVCDAATVPQGEAVARGFAELLGGERDVFQLEYPCHSPSLKRWFLLRATRYAGSGPLRLVVSHTDITERTESERALLSTRNYLKAITNSIGEGVYATDSEGRLTYANQVAANLLGWRLAEVQGRVVHDMARYRHADGSASIEECAISRAWRDGRSVRVDDDVFIRQDGTELPVAYTATPFATEDGVQGCVVVFEDITERKAAARRVEQDLETLACVNQIESALTEGGFVLHAQPIIELATGDVVQHELLLRMRSAEDPAQLIDPDRFLPVAEEYGLVTEIDRWVIDRSAELAATGKPVEINVSARSISDPSLVDYIKYAIVRTGADPAAMVFEITETTMVSDETAARAFVERLHDLGCQVAMDDFGTGYGGFTYLKQLPIDYLKIDIEFVLDVSDNSASRHVVRGIVNLAQGFGLKTVGEGVEDQQTLDLLRELGVDYAQGFHIGRPAPLEYVYPPDNA